MRSLFSMRRGILAIIAGGGLTAAVVVSAFGPQERDPSRPIEAPGESQVAGGVWDLIAYRPFRVETPYTHWWRAERPLVEAGHLLVLAVDPQVALPRQSAEPVLFVGDETAERVNGGYPDGALVLIVPSPRGPDGWPSRDLAAAPIWFGEPALPEQLTARDIIAARTAAAGVQPFGPARVQAAARKGGPGQVFADVVDLRREAARWIQRYAPSERDLAEGLLVPRGR